MFRSSRQMLDGEGVGRSHMGGGHQDGECRVSELHFIAWLTVQPVPLSPSGFDMRLCAPSCAKSRTMKQLTLNRVRQGRGARSGPSGDEKQAAAAAGRDIHGFPSRLLLRLRRRLLECAEEPLLSFN